MEQNKKQTTTSGDFVTRKRYPIPKQPNIEAKSETRSKASSKWTLFKEQKNKVPSDYRKLLRNTMVCAVLALSIWGIKSMDTAVTNQVTDGIKDAVNSSYDSGDDIGRLRFVNAEAYSLPLEGEVVETFSETDKDVKIKGDANSKVRAILSGKVSEVGEDFIKIINDNGTMTTYLGVAPGIKVGAEVKNSDTIGQLSQEVLSLETVSGIGYIDSLDIKELVGSTDAGQ